MLKNPPANIEDTRDLGSVPGLGRYPGVGNGSPLQYSCLENPLDRGAWLTTLHGVTKSWARLKQLSTHTLAPECFTWEVIVPCMCIYTQLESVAMASEHFQTFFTHCRQILGQTPWQRDSLSVSRWAFIFAIWCILNIIFSLFCVPWSCYIHMTFFFQGPNRIFPICTYVHAHPHTHSLIDTLTDHTHSHVTHSPCTYTHYQIQPTSMHSQTDTTHTYTHQAHITHTCIHTDIHNRQPQTHTTHTQQVSIWAPSQALRLYQWTKQTRFLSHQELVSRVKKKLKKIWA